MLLVVPVRGVFSGVRCCAAPNGRGRPKADGRNVVRHAKMKRMDHAEIMKAADMMVAATRYLIDNLRPSKKSPDRLRVAMFLSIAEQFEACVHLFRVKMVSHAAVHVRSMLEALVYMNLLGQKEGYVEQMRYKQLKGQKKVLESILQSEHLPMDAESLIRSKLAECSPDFEKKHQAGIRARQIGDEILEAGLPEMIAPYLMLCGFSHNDLAVLTLRHQGSFSMTYMAPIHDEITSSIFMIAVRIIVQAAESLPKIALFPQGCFEAGFKEMNNAWENALSACDA
ncbi:DUF5677 domain-containing protein [Telluria sp. Tellsp104]